MGVAGEEGMAATNELGLSLPPPHADSSPSSGACFRPAVGLGNGPSVAAWCDLRAVITAPLDSYIDHVESAVAKFYGLYLSIL